MTKASVTFRQVVETMLTAAFDSAASAHGLYAGLLQYRGFDGRYHRALFADECTVYEAVFSADLKLESIWDGDTPVWYEPF